jgi:hypothetical protein
LDSRRVHRWIVIGLLRDGMERTADDIARTYGERTGVAPDRAVLDAELAQLAGDGVLDVSAPHDGAPPTYRLGADGVAAFDGWLTAPKLEEADDDERMTSRLLLLGEVPPADADRLLGRWEAELWERARGLERARAAALAAAPPAAEELAVRPALLDRLLEHVAADLATLAELRTTWDAWRAPSRSA